MDELGDLYFMSVLKFTMWTSPIQCFILFKTLLTNFTEAGKGIIKSTMQASWVWWFLLQMYKSSSLLS